MVTVWSVEGDFSVLGFVTDQINSLISEWYPGKQEVSQTETNRTCSNFLC